MSHFTVLVMGQDVTDPDVLDKLMKPYHEFECTGINEYIEEIDVTADARDTYEKDTTDFFVLADGTRYAWNSDEAQALMYRPATEEESELLAEKGTNAGLRYRQQYDKGGEIYFVLEMPAGSQELSVPTPDVMSFEDWAADYYGCEVVVGEENIDRDGEHKHGYILKTYGGLGEQDTIKVIKRTNPNAEWDWYVVGGRWSGELVLKEGATGVRGRPSWGMETTPDDRWDGAKKSDIDFDAMTKAAQDGRRAAWAETIEKMQSVDETLTPETADAERVRLNAVKIELTSDWEELDKPGRLWDFIEERVSDRDYELIGKIHDYWDGMSETQAKFQSIEDWIQDAKPIASYAMMIDGKWIARGEMGWFGMSSDEVDQNDWQAQVMAAIDALPDDHELVFVDCHI